MKTIEERFADATRHLPRGKAYLAGVSGGRDSVVLLHLLKGAGFAKICVCHFNHGIRKEASDGDAQFTCQLAKESDMRFISDKMIDFNEETLCEEVLRTHRFAFFARAAAEFQANGIFLGHQADDQAETIFWNFLRGSGSQGLSGIQFSSEIQTASGCVRIFRPMLEIWRREIDETIEKHALRFVDDATNLSPIPTRNRLRHEVIPWLEKTLGRNIRENLLRTASLLADENEFLESLATLPTWEPPLSVAFLKMQPIALQRRLIQRWLHFHAVTDVGFAEVERVRALLEVSTGPARCNLPGDRQARRRAGEIFLASQKG